MAFNFKSFSKNLAPVASLYVRRISESGVIARAGLSGKISGLPFPRKWAQSNGPLPPRSDPRASNQRAAGNFFQSFWDTIFPRR